MVSIQKISEFTIKLIKQYFRKDTKKSKILKLFLKIHKKSCRFTIFYRNFAENSCIFTFVNLWKIFVNKKKIENFRFFWKLTNLFENLRSFWQIDNIFRWFKRVVFNRIFSLKVWPKLGHTRKVSRFSFFPLFSHFPLSHVTKWKSDPKYKICRKFYKGIVILVSLE